MGEWRRGEGRGGEGREEEYNGERRGEQGGTEEGERRVEDRRGEERRGEERRGEERIDTLLKGKYHVNLLSFQNPKMCVCRQKQGNNCQVCYKLSLQCNKPSISASSKRQSRSVWMEI